MKPGRPFLTARWSHLALITYAVPRELVTACCPPGCEPDDRDGACFASLVAFDFLDTRVLGVPWPGHRDFPEINLRVYVRRNGERGVAFVREFVPKPLVAWIARGVYGEPYDVAGMDSLVESADGEVTVTHVLRRDGHVHVVHVIAESEPVRPPAEGLDHFFKEHRWGYGTVRAGRLVRYEVEHPVWDVLPIRELRLEWNFGAVYGDAWSFLDEAEPFHTALAVGSDVTVYPRIRE